MIDWRQRGRDFEMEERKGWVGGDWLAVRSETALFLASGRRGRIDILVELEDSRVVIEIKSTDWDNMLDRRVRPNLLRHIRQLRRYTDALTVPGQWLHPALVYPSPPILAGRKGLIEQIGAENFVQIVWRRLVFG